MPAHRLFQILHNAADLATAPQARNPAECHQVSKKRDERAGCLWTKENPTQNVGQKVKDRCAATVVIWLSVLSVLYIIVSPGVNGGGGR